MATVSFPESKLFCSTISLGSKKAMQYTTVVTSSRISCKEGHTIRRCQANGDVKMTV